MTINMYSQFRRNIEPIVTAIVQYEEKVNKGQTLTARERDNYEYAKEQLMSGQQFMTYALNNLEDFSGGFSQMLDKYLKTTKNINPFAVKRNGVYVNNELYYV